MTGNDIAKALGSAADEYLAAAESAPARAARMRRAVLASAAALIVALCGVFAAVRLMKSPSDPKDVFEQTEAPSQTEAPAPTEYSAPPSEAPTDAPTAEPTDAPVITEAPTEAPAETPGPTPSPTDAPTARPTAAPTAGPTARPTAGPTARPTARPTAAPTARPTARPTAGPTARPTAGPTAAPTPAPTAEPTAEPTPQPTAVPMPIPTEVISCDVFPDEDSFRERILEGGGIYDELSEYYFPAYLPFEAQLESISVSEEGVDYVFIFDDGGRFELQWLFSTDPYGYACWLMSNGLPCEQNGPYYTCEGCSADGGALVLWSQDGAGFCASLPESISDMSTFVDLCSPLLVSVYE